MTNGEWDTIYSKMRAAGMKPVRRGWKFRPDGPVEIYTDCATKSEVEIALTGHLDGVSICAPGSRVYVHRAMELDFDTIIVAY
jgi:hypothetical protein